jgi:hypothetical protein
MDETTLEPLVASELDPLELAHQLKERAEIIGEAQQTQLSRLDSLSQLKQRRNPPPPLFSRAHINMRGY